MRQVQDTEKLHIYCLVIRQISMVIHKEILSLSTRLIMHNKTTEILLIDWLIQKRNCQVCQHLLLMLLVCQIHSKVERERGRGTTTRPCQPLCHWTRKSYLFLTCSRYAGGSELNSSFKLFISGAYLNPILQLKKNRSNNWYGYRLNQLINYHLDIFLCFALKSQHHNVHLSYMDVQYVLI